MSTVVKINLTGDYVIPNQNGKSVVGCIETHPDLIALNEFLGHLRNSVGVKDGFSQFVSCIAERLKMPVSPNGVILTVTSSITDGVMRHEFLFASGPGRDKQAD
jgi:hypothetical protein